MGIKILRLFDIRRGDIATAGGKGANLGELAGKGFPVPPGFVVPARACEKLFQSIELKKQLHTLSDSSLEQVGKCCLKIRDTIQKADLPQELSKAIMTAHGELLKSRGSDVVCAVRSSATAEDLGDASFAGQHETYYYVKGENLLKAIKHCWASLWSAEAVSYRIAQGIDHASVFMAVVVQEMILSEISGVTFTANPGTGAGDEVVIESSWGMGAAIVDGRVTPDHYVIERDGLKLREKRIAEKRFMVASRLNEGETTRLREVPHGMRQRETLSPKMLREVAEWSLKAEGHFKSPQDVEWAITDQQFYMLQSRPITVMGREEIGRDVKGKYVLFKALAENFTEPLTPLTGDLMSTEAPPGVKLIRGWIYTSLSPLRTVLPFKISDEELADLLYLSHGTQPPPMKLSFIKLPLFIVIMCLSYLLCCVLFARTRGMPDDFMYRFRNLCQRVEENPEFGPVEAISRLWAWSWKKFFDPAGYMVILVNLSAMRYVFWMGLLKKFVRHWTPDIREDAEVLLCSGTKGVLSVDMGRGIWELAKEAGRHKSIHNLFEKNKPENILSELRAEPEARVFLDQLDCFLAKNGHRALKELELLSTRWEENPAPILGMIRNYLAMEFDPAEHEKKVNKIRSELKAEIIRKLNKHSLEPTLGVRWRLIRFLSDRVKYFTKLRENSRFYHIMAFHVVRKKILRIEAEFMQQGKLKCRNDLFFLNMDELTGMLAGELGWLDVEDRIRNRRMEHIRLSKMLPPKTIGIELREKSKAMKPDTDDVNTLTGQSASPGDSEGIAHVILDPSIEMELKPGEILVAPYTDPAWTPLFLTAGAAVVEVGSYLSHAGTVAREFGMPCVVDVHDCTRRIHTGVRVKVDGNYGIVRILSDDEGRES